MMNSATESIYYTATHKYYQDPWIGKIEKQYLGRWLDDFFYLVWNVSWTGGWEKEMCRSFCMESLWVLPAGSATMHRWQGQDEV